MKEALSSSRSSLLSRATRRNIPEDAILHSHCHEDLKSYIWNTLLKDAYIPACNLNVTLQILINVKDVLSRVKWNYFFMSDTVFDKYYIFKIITWMG
jgi:hypothetical protein